MNNNPTVVAFLCNWCSYTGADLAGTSRMKYNSNVRVIRVMCSGRIGPTFVLKAFREGAEGVLICGCHPGDCHYESGNLKLRGRFALLENLIEEAGIDKQRIHLQWASAAEGSVFAEGVTNMVDRLKKLGPNPVRSDQ